MQNIVSDYLSNLKLGEPRHFRNIVILPIFNGTHHTPDYLTLTEALGQQTATITEVSAGGSVPQVKVINTSELFLLLVDGEELIGARQNRALNTSILLAGKSETIVPVSCTERGRWSYKSPVFADSGFVSPHKLRKVQSDSVRLALMREMGFKSDQSAMWRCVDHLCAQASTKSPTSAMADAMTKMAQELDGFLQALKPLPEQKGLVVLVNGEVAGMDVLSSGRAYQVLHPKFIRSYAMDALLDQKPGNTEKPEEKVKVFFETSKVSPVRVHPGIGCGEDHRFEGQGVAGAALVVAGNVLHLNLYRN